MCWTARGTLRTQRKALRKVRQSSNTRVAAVRKTCFYTRIDIEARQASRKTALRTNFGRYELIETLGRGSMGVVYKARDPLIGRTVAIKAVDLHALVPDEKERYEARFRQEAKAAGSLNHPNLVTIHDIGESDDIAYIAMEFLEGQELGKLHDLSIDDALNIAIQAASGLHYAHQHGIVHRDIKPANIMLLKNNQVKICDFGIARLASPLLRTRTGIIMGSPLYMAPEQIQGKPVDQRADIFSLGIVLYEMLTGSTPFSASTSDKVMLAIVNDMPPKPSTLNPGISEMLDGIVEKCLAKDPAERYQDAGALENDLRVCRGVLLQSQTGADHHKHYFLGHGSAHAHKLSRMVLAAIIILTAIASIGIYELIRHYYHPR
jgi:eukaryotic-like serine/threonine-protein kinase